MLRARGHWYMLLGIRGIDCIGLLTQDLKIHMDNCGSLYLDDLTLGLRYFHCELQAQLDGSGISLPDSMQTKQTSLKRNSLFGFWFVLIT